MSGDGRAWVALGALGVLALGGLLVALVISARRGRQAEHVGEHRRRRGDRR
jgi:hypothetical protein